MRHSPINQDILIKDLAPVLNKHGIDDCILILTANGQGIGVLRITVTIDGHAEMSIIETAVHKTLSAIVIEKNN